MTIYNKLNLNLKNKIDYYIKQNKKKLTQKLHIELLGYFVKTGLKPIIEQNCIIT